MGGDKNTVDRSKMAFQDLVKEIDALCEKVTGLTPEELVIAVLEAVAQIAIKHNVQMDEFSVLAREAHIRIAEKASAAPSGE